MHQQYKLGWDKPWKNGSACQFQHQKWLPLCQKLLQVDDHLLVEISLVHCLLAVVSKRLLKFIIRSCKLERRFKMEKAHSDENAY